MYAVVDPATGEQIKAYPTATDAEIRAACRRQCRGARRLGRPLHR
jgi:acyl-CoA reductase-like NAD-dependent aldehyde dehydrogenase